MRAALKAWIGWLKNIKLLRSGGGFRQAGKEQQDKRLALIKGSGNPDERSAMIRELRKAHQDWVCAQERLHYVLEPDEVDYAIFVLEAAEKRYGMLLKRAKALKVTAVEWSALTPQKAGKTIGG